MATFSYYIYKLLYDRLFETYFNAVWLAHFLLLTSTIIDGWTIICRQSNLHYNNSCKTYVLITDIIIYILYSRFVNDDDRDDLLGPLDLQVIITDIIIYYSRFVNDDDRNDLLGPLDLQVWISSLDSFRYNN